MRAPVPALLLALVLAPAVPGAHEPSLLKAGAPKVIDDPTISHAIYGVFETGEELFKVRLTFAEPFAFPVELLVPHRDELREHRPVWAVVGPGLPVPAAADLARFPEALPAGHGAWFDWNQVSPRPVIYEFVMRRFFWSSEPVAVFVPAGTCEVWVWSPARTKGKVVLGIGVEEGGDYMQAFADWSVYAY